MCYKKSISNSAELVGANWPRRIENERLRVRETFEDEKGKNKFSSFLLLHVVYMIVTEKKRNKNVSSLSHITEGSATTLLYSLRPSNHSNCVSEDLQSCPSGYSKKKCVLTSFLLCHTDGEIYYDYTALLRPVCVLFLLLEEHIFVSWLCDVSSQWHWTVMLLQWTSFAVTTHEATVALWIVFTSVRNYTSREELQLKWQELTLQIWVFVLSIVARGGEGSLCSLIINYPVLHQKIKSLSWGC